MPTAVLNGEISSGYDLQDEQMWEGLINLLRVRTRHFVYSARVGCWRGQEEDIIEDIVQEAAYRMFERFQRAASGEASPVYSLRHMALMIAHHYSIDLLRHDRRLWRVSSDGNYPDEEHCQDDQSDLFEIAIEQVIQEELFAQLARVIALFPEKRRKALLIDLANRMYFDEEQTTLQSAFLAEGIDLQAYQHTLPTDSVERTRHSALIRLAYKQVTTAMREQSLVDQGEEV